MIEDIFRVQDFAAHEPWLAHLIPDHGKLAFDIGANTGIYAQELARRFEKVIACEPAVESFEHLEACEEPEIVALNVAVAGQDGELETWVEEAPMRSGQLVCKGSGHELRPRMVPCRTLDSLAAEYGPPEFVKIDTEGFELHVLEGADTTLREHRPQLLVEVHGHFALGSRESACEKLLSKYGYSEQIIEHPDAWEDYYWLAAR